MEDFGAKEIKIVVVRPCLLGAGVGVVRFDEAFLHLLPQTCM
jgi:hypothetical protein